MKPKSTLRSFLLACSSLLAVSFANAQSTYYWDSNSTTAGLGNTTGTWGTSNFLNDDPTGGAGGAFTTASTSLDTLNFGTATLDYANSSVGVAVGGVSIGDIVFGAGQTTAITALGTAGNAITIQNGITKNAGSAAISFTGPIVLGAAQTWTNNSASVLGVGGSHTLTNGGFTLTIAGSGTTNLAGTGGNQFTISGLGGITKNGTGFFALGSGAAPTHTYSGDTTLNGGVTMFSANLQATTNVNLNGGILESYWSGGLTRALGAAAGELRITGGESGFSTNGATGATFNLGASVIAWGSTNFSPTKFILQSAYSQSGAAVTFSSPLNLNGADRTVVANSGVAGNATSTISGALSNSAGTAGLIKEGAGNLILSATNTYNGSTTITAGTLTANSTAALGNSTATNTLIFNGGILRAGGAITSVAARGVTLTSTGIIDNNGQAVSIAGNITGAGGLTKNGTGTLTLSGTNSYGGVTTVNAGTLAITKEAALYNSTPASWTAANINVKSGAALNVNVDSAGTAGFTEANLTTLLGNILVANTAAEGVQGGVTLGIDTGAGTFTPSTAITNSTGAFGGVINLNKLGSGTLVFNQTNTYTGNTIVSAGTIRYDTGAAIPATPITNNGAFTFNAAGALTQGTNFGIISGTGSVTQSGANSLTLNLANTYSGATNVTTGTLILSNALAIQNSALNTTGAGFVTLSGVTTPTFGGLSNSGTTRDLATVISTGYDSVTNLTLNPNAGSVTYDGVIADGAAGMTLTKTGAGTQVLTGIQAYTGATYLNVGTLTLSGAGSILPSAITFNGGGLTLTNTAAETGSGRVNDTTGITSNGGTITYNNTSGSNVYAETIGSVALIRGQLNIVQAVNQAGAGSQTLTLAGLTRTGAANTSAITFSALTTAPNATKNMILVTGATPVPTAANQIIGPWATTGTTAAVQTKWAVYDASGYVIPDTIADTAEGSWVDSTTDAWSYNPGANSSLTGARTAAAFRYLGASATLDLGNNNLSTNGVFFAGANAMTISSTGTGVLTSISGGPLYLTAGQSVTHTISAFITNAGGTTSLAKSGAGTVILNGAGNYTFGGDIAVNAGTLQVGASQISTQLSGGTYAGNIFIARGAAFTLQGNASNNLSGVISGDGNLNLNRGTTTLSGANTYTGKTSMSLVATNAVGSTMSVSSFNSVNGGTPLLASSSLGCPTTVANGTIDFGGGGIQQSAQINYTGSGETTDRIINFQFNGNGANRTIDASGSGLLKFTSTFTSSGSTNNNVVLQGSSNGEIVGGLPFSFANFTKSGAGTWTLGGPVRNSGTTTASGTGTLVLSGPLSNTGLTSVTGGAILTLSGNNSSMTGGVTVTASRLNIGNANALGTGALSIGGTAPSIDNTSGSALTIATNNAQNWNGDFTFAGSNDLNLGTGAVALGGTRNVTVTANTLTVGGVISGISPRGIQKTGAGTLVLAGANTYGGNTTVSGGTLALGANDVLPNTNVTIANGTLNAGTFDDAVGTLTVTNAASTINLGAGANLVFADSSGATWTGTLNITGTFVSGSSLKFGSSDTALTDTQLLAISATGWTGFDLDVSGNLIATPTSGDPYATWSGGADFDADANGDGVDNGMAWVLGATNKDANATALQPTFDNTTDPDYFIFTYRRKDDANTDPNTAITVEYGTNLGSWATAVDNADIDILVDDNDYSVTPGVDRVEVKFKRSTLAPDGVLFVRLKTVKTP